MVEAAPRDSALPSENQKASKADLGSATSWLINGMAPRMACKMAITAAATMIVRAIQMLKAPLTLSELSKK